MLVQYQHHLIAMELLPADADTFKFNSITRKDHIYFVNHPDAIALSSATCKTTTDTTSNTGIEDNFKLACSPANPFRKSIERDKILFTTFKEGKIGMIGV